MYIKSDETYNTKKMLSTVIINTQPLEYIVYITNPYLATLTEIMSDSAVPV